MSSQSDITAQEPSTVMTKKDRQAIYEQKQMERMQKAREENEWQVKDGIFLLALVRVDRKLQGLIIEHSLAIRWSIDSLTRQHN